MENLANAPNQPRNAPLTCSLMIIKARPNSYSLTSWIGSNSATPACTRYASFGFVRTPDGVQNIRLDKNSRKTRTRTGEWGHLDVTEQQ